MGGVFGVASKDDCVMDLFFGVDYHSHLGTYRGGMAAWNGEYIYRKIHNIQNDQFRSKFDRDLSEMSGPLGIGSISDTDAQPLSITSHLGNYAICTVAKVNNEEEILREAFKESSKHFVETSRGKINQTELIASLINTEKSFEKGIRKAQTMIDGSCTILILTKEGIYAARDLLGRTPLSIGKKKSGHCVTFETCAFNSLGYQEEYELGPGEVVYITPEKYETVVPREEKMKICTFLWVYFGYSASKYEGTNVEMMRYKNGELMAKREKYDVDIVAGVPDSGTAHAIGYANALKVPFLRPFIKYTPTWPRSFMPQEQKTRNLVARMKLMPVKELIKDKKLLFCDDSIVRGTQLREAAEYLFDNGAKEVHIRAACPPLLYGCKYINFSRSRSNLDLITRRTIKELEGDENAYLDEYADPSTDRYKKLIDTMCKDQKFTSLQYQHLEDMIEAAGIEKCQACTYCWNGKE